MTDYTWGAWDTDTASSTDINIIGDTFELAEYIPASGVSRWTFDNDDTSSGTAIDSWGSNDGTINGATTGASGLAGYDSGEAYSLDGSDDWVDATTMGTFGQSLGSCSFLFWVNTTTTSTVDVCGTFNDNLTTGMRISINRNENGNNADGKIHAFSRDDNENYLRAATSTDTGINDGAAHSLIVTFDRSTGEIGIYVDGSAESLTYNGQSTSSSFSDYQYPMAIGAANGRGTITGHFSGDIDDPRAYNKPLSSTEASNLDSTGSIDG